MYDTTDLESCVIDSALFGGVMYDTVGCVTISIWL